MAWANQRSPRWLWPLCCRPRFARRQALWWSSPATRVAPLAVTRDGRLLAVCPHAAAAGCAPGQTTAQARLLCPTLVICSPSPGETWLWETALRALATVSPVVEETDRQRGVACLDGHGLERLWGPPTLICQRALDALATEGLQAWAGAGPTRLIALACAERQGPHGAPVVREGPEAACAGWLGHPLAERRHDHPEEAA